MAKKGEKKGKKKKGSRGNRYTPEDRLVHTKAWFELRAGGMSASAAADRIGIPYVTLKTWSSALEVEKQPAEKQPAEKKAVPFHLSSDVVTVTTPSGHTVAGSTGDVLYILQHLGI
jgi:hypothetical protein